MRSRRKSRTLQCRTY